MPHPLGDELTELHVHLGGAVDPAAMWGIAHEQGIRLPTKDYWEFVDLITVRKQAAPPLPAPSAPVAFVANATSAWR